MTAKDVNLFEIKAPELVNVGACLFALVSAEVFEVWLESAGVDLLRLG